MIKFNNPSLGVEEENAAIRVIRSGHLTMGEEVKALEQELAAYLNAPYVVAVDSCTNALFLSLQYLNQNHRPGFLGCPGMTFASVANVILHAGHSLRFTDEYHAGTAYELQNTNIWDCAHQLERDMYKPGTVQCFSFYPNKMLSSAEGGAIATDNLPFVIWLEAARWNGRHARTFADYDILFPGWKMNMTDIQAAIAREQLKKMDAFNQRRAEIKAEYDRYFTQVNDWHYLYVISVKHRDLFMQKLKEKGVETSFHYKPLYEQPAFAAYKGQYPFLTSIKDHIVTLPLYPALSDDEVQQVIKVALQYA